MGTNDSVPQTLLTNLNNYLQNFKMLTDIITFNDGYVVNFGVIFDVIAEKYADKQQVNLNCIQKTSCRNVEIAQAIFLLDVFAMQI